MIIGENIFSGFITFSFVEINFIYVRESANLSAAWTECRRSYSIFNDIKFRCDFVEKGNIGIRNFELIAESLWLKQLLLLYSKSKISHFL